MNYKVQQFDYFTAKLCGEQKNGQYIVYNEKFADQETAAAWAQGMRMKLLDLNLMVSVNVITKETVEYLVESNTGTEQDEPILL